jgi:hypothetical protein
MQDIFRDRCRAAGAATYPSHWELLHTEKHLDGGDGAHPGTDEQCDARVEYQAIGNVGLDQGCLLVVAISIYQLVSARLQWPVNCREYSRWVMAASTSHFAVLGGQDVHWAHSALLCTECLGHCLRVHQLTLVTHVHLRVRNGSTTRSCTHVLSAWHLRKARTWRPAARAQTGSIPNLHQSTYEGRDVQVSTWSMARRAMFRRRCIVSVRGRPSRYVVAELAQGWERGNEAKGVVGQEQAGLG